MEERKERDFEKLLKGVRMKKRMEGLMKMQINKKTRRGKERRHGWSECEEQRNEIKEAEKSEEKSKPVIQRKKMKLRTQRRNKGARPSCQA